jgi:hypothetical protein
MNRSGRFKNPTRGQNIVLKGFSKLDVKHVKYTGYILSVYEGRRQRHTRTAGVGGRNSAPAQEESGNGRE